MAFVTTTISMSHMLTKGGFLDYLMREIATLKGATVYMSPQTADTLIRWELSEFDPHFVHEDF